MKNAEELVAKLSLKEKISLMSGAQSLREMLELLNQDESQHYNFVPFTAGGIAEKGIPDMRFCDGPRGVVCGVGKTTCFPVTMCRGASFDVALEERIGAAMGRETRGAGGNLFAGICINLPYHPGWGRSQETYGEESFHLGEMGAALTRGVQSEHVIGCVKHYAFNQMEISRFKVNVECDKRTEREVFLPHFKRVVDAGADAVMSSYNLFQSVHCGHHKYLLRDLLKNQWGFSGFVMSDFIWGVRDTVEAANGGQDMEMCCTEYFGEKLEQAVRDGFVAESVIDESAVRIVKTLCSVEEAYQASGKQYDTSVLGCEEHRRLALQSAREGITLLKNKNNFLPLSRSGVKKVAVIGRLADYECIGDHGSSQVYPPYVITPLQGIKNYCTEIQVVSCDGSDKKETASMVKDADAVIVVAGYDFNDEGEYVSENENEAYTGSIGGDRQSLRLHQDEVELIHFLSEKSRNLTVVLMGGNTILMDEWYDEADAVLMAYYPGMEGGRALAEIIFGEINPSGKLPFVIPQKEEDLPEISWDTTRQYYEYYHGYARLEKYGIRPFLPYGFGLSYTEFEIGDVNFYQTDTEIGATYSVKNIGQREGTEVVQLYVGFENSAIDRPVKLLRGFCRVNLKPGEMTQTEISCLLDEIRYYDPVDDKMKLEHMTYQMYIGTSSSEEDLIKGEIKL